jgi:hypothetical protein
MMAAMAKPRRTGALALAVLLAATAAGAAEPAPPAAALDAPVENRPLPPQTWAYGASGFFLLTGLGMGYWAQGETQRAQSLTSARGTSAALSKARTYAASSQVMYGLAGLSLLYGLALQFLPPKTADKVDLTVNF